MGGSVLRYFENMESLKILLCLYRYNPDLTLQYIAENTKIPSAKVSSILLELISEGLVTVKQDNTKQVYSLSQMTRNAMDRVVAQS